MTAWGLSYKVAYSKKHTRYYFLGRHHSISSVFLAPAHPAGPTQGFQKSGHLRAIPKICPIVLETVDTHGWEKADADATGPPQLSASDPLGWRDGGRGEGRGVRRPAEVAIKKKPSKCLAP